MPEGSADLNGHEVLLVINELAEMVQFASGLEGWIGLVTGEREKAFAVKWAL